MKFVNSLPDFDMGMFCVRISVRGVLNKVYMRDLFIHKRTFQLKLDPLFEVEVFACSRDAFNMNSSCSAGYYIQCSSNHALTSLKVLVAENMIVTESEDYDFETEDEYGYDSLFCSGFLIWHN